MLIVVACLIALIGAQKLINTIYPPRPKAPRPPVVAVTNTPVQSAETAKPAEKTAETAPETKTESEAPRPAEEIITLSNDFVRVDFTSWGGGVRSVELLRHKANGHGSATLNGAGLVPALSLVGVPGAGSNDVFAIQRVDEKSVRLHSGNGVLKTVTLSNEYVMAATVQIPATLAPSGTVSLVVGTAQPTQLREIPNYLVVDWEGASKFHNRTQPSIVKRERAGTAHDDIRAGWVAVKSQYFTMVLSPTTNVTGVTYATVNLATPAPAPTNHGVTAVADVPLAPGTNGSASCAFTFYTGPKDYDRLAALGSHQEELMDFGTPLDLYSGLFGFLLLRSLNFFYRLVPSYGVAIILVTITLKIIFWPIQAKSIQSMKAMQKFQPLMNKLREKYKDDQQRLHQEMMKLYKEHKINPFSGCLPMLVQLPVLIAFYRVLVNAIALRGAPFLWIKDLAQPDTIASFAGIDINLLPILMVAGTYGQQKLTPTGGDPQQQKMMAFMPLMMLFFFYKLAAGLTLYYTLQQALSLLQQYWGMRQTRGAATAVPITSAGKAK